MNIGHLIHEWMESRALVTAAERAEHPDIVDHHGRTWVWIRGELYRHCDMAWSADQIRDTDHRLPSERVRNNPNYNLCQICKGATDAS